MPPDTKEDFVRLPDSIVANIDHLIDADPTLDLRAVLIDLHSLRARRRHERKRRTETPTSSSLGLLAGLTYLAGLVTGMPLLRPLSMGLGQAASKFDRVLNADEVQSRDVRNRVVFLRSFRDEADGKLRSLEEAIRFVGELVGPVVAIGNPTDRVAPNGVARDYVKDGPWQDRVLRWVDEAKLVFLVIGETPGVAWEALSLAGKQALSKVVLVLPPLSNSAHERRNQAFFGGTSANPSFATAWFAAKPGTLAISFGTSGDVLAIRSCRKDANAQLCALECAVAQVKLNYDVVAPPAGKSPVACSPPLPRGFFFDPTGRTINAATRERARSDTVKSAGEEKRRQTGSAIATAATVFIGLPLLVIGFLIVVEKESGNRPSFTKEQQAQLHAADSQWDRTKLIARFSIETTALLRRPDITFGDIEKLAPLDQDKLSPDQWSYAFGYSFGRAGGRKHAVKEWEKMKVELEAINRSFLELEPRSGLPAPTTQSAGIQSSASMPTTQPLSPPLPSAPAVAAAPDPHVPTLAVYQACTQALAQWRQKISTGSIPSEPKEPNFSEAYKKGFDDGLREIMTLAARGKPDAARTLTVKPH